MFRSEQGERAENRGKTRGFETVAIPFKLMGNRQVLTDQQIAEHAYLRDFVKAFAHCFEHDPVSDVMVFYPDGRPA